METVNNPGPSQENDNEKENVNSNRAGESTEGEEKEKEGKTFECNICLDTAKDAVISMCGHLFCWPCLHRWLETKPNQQMCPVCKAAISKERVIPLYGRGSTERQDPRDKAPPRPAGQRSEPENNTVGKEPKTGRSGRTGPRAKPDA